MLNGYYQRWATAFHFVAFSTTLLIAFACNAVTEKPSLSVLAVEYPPFTTSNVTDRGINFRLFSKAVGHRFTIKPVFVPPARAEQVLRSSPWCVSFYPPKGMDDSVTFIPLSEQRVELAFYRAASSSERVSSLHQLANERIAVLRVKELGPFHQPLLDVGAELLMVESIAQGLELLTFGRVDSILADDDGVKSALSRMQDQPVLERSKLVYFETMVGAHLNKQCPHFEDLAELLRNTGY